MCIRDRDGEGDQRVAREVPEPAGHSLVTLSMQLEAVQRLYPVDPDRDSAQ